VAFRKNDFHPAARSRSGTFCSVVRRDRHRQYWREMLRRGRVDFELSASGEKLIGVELVPPRHLGNRRSFFEALIDDPALLVPVPGPTFAPDRR